MDGSDPKSEILERLETSVRELVEAQQSAVPGSSEEAEDQAGRIRDLKYRVNNCFWEVVQAQLADCVRDAGEGPLQFSEDVRRFLDYGWVSDDLFPAKDLPPLEGDFHDPEFRVLHFSEWIEDEDARHMEVEKSRALVARLQRLEAERVRREEGVQQLTAQRREWINAELGPWRDQVEQLYLTMEKARLTVAILDEAKRLRSIQREEVRSYDTGIREGRRSQTELETFLDRISADMQAVFREATDSLVRNRLAMHGIHRQMEKTRDEIREDRGRKKLLLAERGNVLREQLGHIRDDIGICSRWGRSEAHAVLFGQRRIHRKAEFVEAIRTIQDYDPEVFRNRRAEMKGMPLVLLTPGTGNGSFDFRSNTMVIPISPARSIEESAAYAMALYRRDVDNARNEGKLWDSFFDTGLWRKIRDRERPTSLRDRMNFFAGSYLKWATREAKGQAVLHSEIRRWFEDNVAPSRRAPIFPRRALRMTAMERMETLDTLQGADTAEDLYLRGALQFQVEDFDAAVESFLGVLALDPHHARAHWAVGVLFSMDSSHAQTCGFSRHMNTSLRDRLDAALEGFRAFVRHAPQSWWMLKAQEAIRESQFSIGRAEDRTAS